jgi:hypothetical protein
MAGLTLAQAEAKLAEWVAADTALQAGQVVRMGDRILTRVDALEIRNNITYWDMKTKELDARESGIKRSRTVSPSW